MSIGLEQGSDGFLYVDAPGGLMRFDGVTFEPVTMAEGGHRLNSTVLLKGRDGELWIGQQPGDVAVLRNGALHDTHMPHPPKQITDLAQTTDGALWASYGGAGERLFRLGAGRWQTMDKALGLPDGYVTDLKAAPDGALWLAMLSSDNRRGTLLRLAPGGRAFEVQPDPVLFARMIFDPKGRLWVVDRLGIRMLRDTTGRPPLVAVRYVLGAALRFSNTVFDQTGALWGTTRASGLFRIEGAGGDHPERGVVTRFTEADGLSANITNDITVDREGDVWVSTNGGVDRFRRTAVKATAAIPVESSSGLQMAKVRDGSIFIGSEGKLFEIGRGDLPERVRGSDLDALCPAQDGGLWSVGPTRLVHRSADGTETAFPAHLQGTVTVCAEDRDGRLWIAQSNGLAWRDRRGWGRIGAPVNGREVWNLALTPEGGPVFSVGGADVGWVHEGRLHMGALKGCGLISDISTGRDAVFVSACRALFRLRNGRFETLGAGRVNVVNGVRGVVQTDRGETWILGSKGLVRFSTSELDRAFNDPKARLSSRVFSFKDGIKSPIQHVGYRGVQGAEARDGRLWFLTAAGVVSVDPGDIPTNRMPPPVVIKTVSTRARSFEANKDLALPGGTRALDIAYSGLSLSLPERMQFRYRLDPVDKDWVDPGLRRIASYANLGPGKYAFRVKAANNDGVWNERGAETRFLIHPTFLQSWPFKLLCLLLVGACVWAAYRLRVAALTERVRRGMEERSGERERIARELHDTLLQSIHGLMLRFQLAAEGLPAGSAVRAQLEEALDRADEVIVEGRDRVRDLRPASIAQQPALETALEDLARRVGPQPPAIVHVHARGAVRPLTPAARPEVLTIVGEALFNVAKHAAAKEVEVRITYGAWGLEVCVADDGVGFSDSVLKAGRRDGHFGLQGMRERAQALRGSLSLDRLAKGSRVTLRVPAAVAYASPAGAARAVEEEAASA